MIQNSINFLLLVGLVGSSHVFFSCGNSAKTTSNEERNSTQSGQMDIGVDATFRPLLSTCIETFEGITKKTSIQAEYQSQEQAFEKLLDGSLDLIIVGRTLTESEVRSVKERGLKPKVNVIAYDALAFISSKKSSWSKISTNQLNALLTGQQAGSIVCDVSNSGNLVYLKEKFSIKGNMQNIFAAGSDSAVIDYISSHPDAIGIVGMSYVSDYDDAKVLGRFDKIKLLTIQYKDSLGVDREGYPVQEQLFTQDYPFMRKIFVVNLDGQTNLGTGFANFLVSERGQRIALKLGLLPFDMPTRNILIKTNTNY